MCWLQGMCSWDSLAKGLGELTQGKLSKLNRFGEVL